MEEKFITAILTQAVEDARYTKKKKKYLKHKIESINWIMSNDPQFKYYCKLLNIEPSYIRNKIKMHGDVSISFLLALDCINCVCICFNTGDIFEKAITSSSNPNSLPSSSFSSTKYSTY